MKANVIAASKGAFASPWLKNCGSAIASWSEELTRCADAITPEGRFAEGGQQQ